MNTSDLSLRGLHRLRWAAVTGQTAMVIFCVDFLRIRLPVMQLLLVLVVAVLSQLLLWRELRRGQQPQPAFVGGVLAFDIFLLTALLFYTGGPHNPFSAFYLIHIAIAATLLTAGWTWALLGVTMLCYTGLFWRHIPLPLMQDGEPVCGVPPMQLHLAGMFVALSLTGACLAWFVARLNTQLRAREAALHEAQLKAEQQARFAALATLAAGAAHELATPLGTMAIAISEVQRNAKSLPEHPELTEDAELIREEIARCRQILDRLQAEAGDAVRELSAAEIIAEIKARFPKARLEFHSALPGPFAAPPHSLVQALSSLIKNALDASPENQPVSLQFSEVGQSIRFLVQDRGSGLSEKARVHAGEPFFTTKPPGQGMGLGLFLVQLLAKRLNGSFDLATDQTGTTSATLILPKHSLTAGGDKA